ncbi:MAG: hypothetical protein IKW35_04915 [Paludibacteraceae bacterium]|nr:hypothetical protein [Paludibacteraceae bacterium]
MDKQLPTQSKPIPPLWLCILIDIIGMLSYLIPGMGEWMDTIWAPISACLFGILFGGTRGTIIAFLEEALPFTDIIPTFTITYFLRKRKADKTILQRTTTCVDRKLFVTLPKNIHTHEDDQIDSHILCTIFGIVP